MPQGWMVTRIPALIFDGIVEIGCLYFLHFEARISQGIENFINLVALYLLKAILFPLGFFYVAIFAIRQLWRVELNPGDPV
ncbi:MAG: hypothetical protein GY889_16245 [Proteobacteria bacterium]|nr:hypothetical protein [Pseudomonadota bacterium]